MTAKEIFAGGFWTASVIAVSGFTYQAFKDTYTRFPDPATGDKSNPVSVSQNTPPYGSDKLLRKGGVGYNNPVYKTVRKIADGIMPPKVHTQSAPYLPELKQAINSHNRQQAIQYWNANLAAFGGGTGDALGRGQPLGQLAMAIWISQNGLTGKFRALTGIDVNKMLPKGG